MGICNTLNREAVSIEQGAEANIWTWEGGSGGRLEKTA